MRLVIFALIISTLSSFAQNDGGVLKSPDGWLEISFETVKDQLVYAVSFRGKSVIEPSEMNLHLEGQPALGKKVRIVNTSRATTDETYHLVTGKVSEARDHHNALKLELEEIAAPNRKLEIEARAFDDAVAFRYVVPEQPNLSGFRLTKEATEFRFSKDAMTYSLELPNFRSMYESEFIKLPISAMCNQGGVRSEVLCGLPMLLDVPNIAWVAIMDADLRDYSSMYLVSASPSWTGHWLESRLAPQVGNTNLCVTGALPHQSSWRVLMVADDPGRFIESTVLTSLNPPTTLTNTAWIQAGKATWDWWCGSRNAAGKSEFSTDTMNYYVDFAAKSGFRYMLIDAGWFSGKGANGKSDITQMNGRVDVPEVVKYAAAKKVKIWIWAGYEPLNRQMDEALALYERWGVAGVKTDFIERDDQEGMKFYYRCAEKAAEHHIMMDFHGGTKPSGLDRTWPNVLGYEAVAGMEQSKAGMRDNPDQHVMLPFTRMIAGPMDYTPGAFDNVTRDRFFPRDAAPMVMGTRAHQLAMYAVYQAASQMVSDWPGNYESQPEFQFIKDVPATWDETRALNGVPGEYVTIARRSGSDWYLGSMTGWTPRELNVPLTFLGEGRYTAEIYADATDADKFPKHAVISKKTVKRSTTLKIQLAPGGGCAVRFVPMK